MDKATASDFTKSIRSSRLRSLISRSIQQACKSDVLGLHEKIRTSRSALKILQRDINPLLFVEWATACVDLSALDEVRADARKHHFLLHMNEELAILAEEDHEEVTKKSRQLYRKGKRSRSKRTGNSTLPSEFVIDIDHDVIREMYPQICAEHESTKGMKAIHKPSW